MSFIYTIEDDDEVEIQDSDSDMEESKATISDDNNEEGIVAKILEKKKAVSNSIKVNFFDMPSQLLPEK